MAGTKDEILEFLQGYKNRKEKTDIELVKIESRLEDRIKEAKTDLKGDILQVKTDLLQVKTDLENNIRGVKTDLENDIKGVKTDLENDIQVVRDDIKERISGLRWFIGITVAIAAFIVPLIIKYL